MSTHTRPSRRTSGRPHGASIARAGRAITAERLARMDSIRTRPAAPVRPVSRDR